MKLHLDRIIEVRQTRAADKYNIEQKPISSIELMEDAAKAFIKALEKHCSSNQQVIVLYGTGNNGGDGLAVCRLLIEKAYNTTAALINTYQLIVQLTRIK